MKSLQCIYKKQAINFAPLQSAEGHKCSWKENEELNQGNKILLVSTWALNLNQVTVGNGPVVCPCTPLQPSKEEERPITCEPVMQLLLAREESLL